MPPSVIFAEAIGKRHEIRIRAATNLLSQSDKSMTKKETKVHLPVIHVGYTVAMGSTETKNR